MRRLTSVFMICALCVLASCSADKKKPTEVTPPVTSPFMDLTKMDHTLINLEQSYERKSQTRFDQLLDTDFTFFFGDQDVQNNAVPAEWDRTREMASVTNLFDPTFIPRDNNGQPRQDAGPVESITLDLDYVSGEDEWAELPAPDQVNYPGEMWYQKTVEYSLTVRAGELNLQNSQPLFATIMVRPVNVDGEQQFRVVQWHDDILGGSASASSVDRAAAATEETTWGGIKSIFE